jgi:acyl-coenzyme A synthetase/AMP-(fatty) acid ligase
VERVVRERTGLAPDRLLPVAPNTIPKTTSGKVRRATIQQRLTRLFQGGTGAASGRDVLLPGSGRSEVESP